MRPCQVRAAGLAGPTVVLAAHSAATLRLVPRSTWFVVHPARGGHRGGDPPRRCASRRAAGCPHWFAVHPPGRALLRQPDPGLSQPRQPAGPQPQRGDAGAAPQPVPEPARSGAAEAAGAPSVAVLRSAEPAVDRGGDPHPHRGARHGLARRPRGGAGRGRGRRAADPAGGTPRRRLPSSERSAAWFAAGAVFAVGFGFAMQENHRPELRSARSARERSIRAGRRARRSTGGSFESRAYGNLFHRGANAWTRRRSSSPTRSSSRASSRTTP